MKGDKIVIQHLNKVLANQLIAINQFFLHSRMLEDWGIEGLGHHSYRYSIKEMKLADDVIKRILFLEGIPNLQDLGKLYIGENTQEMLICDRQLKEKSAADIREAIICCEGSSDYISRDELKRILEHDEDHIDWLDTQLELIEKMGIENYIQASVPKED